MNELPIIYTGKGIRELFVKEDEQLPELFILCVPGSHGNDGAYYYHLVQLARPVAGMVRNPRLTSQRAILRDRGSYGDYSEIANRSGHFATRIGKTIYYYSPRIRREYQYDADTDIQELAGRWLS